MTQSHRAVQRRTLARHVRKVALRYPPAAVVDHMRACPLCQSVDWDRIGELMDTSDA